MTTQCSYPLRLPHLVSVPSLLVPSPAQARVWGQVALRLDGSVAPREVLGRWHGLVPVRRLRVAATGAPCELLVGVGQGLRVDWVVDSAAAQRLSIEALAFLRDEGVVAWAVPRPEGGETLVDVVIQAGLAGWPVSLEPTAGLLRGGEELLSILDFYLFHPGLSVPVEPLHSLLLGLMGGRPRRLWEIWFGAPADLFYLHEGGAVSLCEAWAAKDVRCYGGIKDSPELWRASAPHAALRALVKDEGSGPKGSRKNEFEAPRLPRRPASEARGGRIPRRIQPTSNEAGRDGSAAECRSYSFASPKARAHPSCAACEAERLCGGAVISLDPEASCESWREVVARLRLAAASLTTGRARSPGVRPTPARTGT